jgi:ferrous iron transport protein B
MTSHPDVLLETGRPMSSPKKLTAALVGNPNTGKTTLFNALSGMRQRTGNYPGVTVETKKGSMTCGGRAFDLIDLPGTYSLAPRSPDEMVAVDVILGRQEGEARPDVVVSIVDASNLDRNLYLTSQAMELGVPLVVALNMIDVAAGQGLHIDVSKLSHSLGVPVVPIQANKKIGLDRLRGAISAAATEPLPPAPSPKRGGREEQSPPPPRFGEGAGGRGFFPAAFDREVSVLHLDLGGDVPLFLVRRLLLDVGGYTEKRLIERYGEHIRSLVMEARQRLAAAGCPVPAVEAKARYAWIRHITAGCVERPKVRPVSWTDRLDRVLTHKLWGSLVFLAVMFVVFQSIFTWAKPLMKWIAGAKDLLAGVLSDHLPAGAFTALLLDGVLEGVGSVVQFLPQILILFAFIAVLEDCGYMARAAFLMDKLMARCGLSGKSFIPMLSSVACAVPGIMATRVIENRRDRLATILVAPLMSCSARLPVYTLLIGAFLTDGYPIWMPGLVMFAMYSIGIVIAPLVALVLKRTLLRGETPAFVMEMPLYKRPDWRTVGRRVYDSGWAFVRRAGTVILATMVFVWALLYFPHRDAAGVKYDDRIAAVKQAGGEEEEQTDKINAITAEWKRDSILGRFGRAIEPAVKPLGWDWRVAVAALASFPAREVVVGTLGIVYQKGKVESEDKAAVTELGAKLADAKWEGTGRKVFTVPVALSLMVFFALCCQCASTLAVIRRETRSWGWPAFTFVYMTVLAYLGALVTYQVGTMFS